MGIEPWGIIIARAPTVDGGVAGVAKALAKRAPSGAVASERLRGGHRFLSVSRPRQSRAGAILTLRLNVDIWFFMRRKGKCIDPYDVLGIDAAATVGEINAAYRRRAKGAHPDTGGSAQEFGEVKIAHTVLSDPDVAPVTIAPERLRS